MFKGLKKLQTASSLQIINSATKIEAAPNLRIDPRSEGALERPFSRFFSITGGLFGTKIARHKAATSRLRSRNEGSFEADRTSDGRSVFLEFH